MVTMNTLERIQTATAPAPSGHYSQATVHNDLVFVSGQLPTRPDGGESSRAFEAQVHQALSNLFEILRAADSGPEQVLKVTAFLVGIENWPVFNRIFGAAFGEARPARSVMPVPHLYDGFLIEIEAVAVRRAPSRVAERAQGGP
jgi:2-iminobutanoate/2-iminopropanoate deaminase